MFEVINLSLDDSGFENVIFNDNEEVDVGHVEANEVGKIKNYDKMIKYFILITVGVAGSLWI